MVADSAVIEGNVVDLDGIRRLILDGKYFTQWDRRGRS
jgi:hypothetical protein